MATNQTQIVQSLRILGTLVVLLGFASLVLISIPVWKSSQEIRSTDIRFLAGYSLGFGAIVIQSTALLIGQDAAETLMSAPYAIYWMYWPLFSYIPMLVMTASSGALLLLSFILIHYRKKLRIPPNLFRPTRTITFLSFSIFGVVLPLTGLHEFIDGNYLFGRVSSTSPASEAFSLFERTMAYGTPDIVYLNGVATGDSLSIILGITGLLYIVLICLALFSIILAFSMEEIRKTNQTNTRLLFSVGRHLALISVALIWIVYTSVYLFNGWPTTYDVFLDSKGLWFGFLTLVCVYVSTSRGTTMSDESNQSESLPKTTGFVKSLKHPLWIVSLMFLFLTTSMAIDGVTSSYLSIQPTIEVEDNIQNCLEKYEQKFVQSIMNPSYGFTPTDGYPMYLFALGEMYYWMFSTTEEVKYKDHLLSLANSSLSIINEDWTWNMGWRNRISNLYNSLAAKLFLYCFDVTQDQIFLNYANNSLQALLLDGVVNFSGTNNDKFLAFTVIAAYLAEVADPDDNLWEFGARLYNFSIAQYDVQSHLWYYGEDDMILEIFDAHDAFYELLNIYNYLKHRTAISQVYPDFNTTLYEYTPDMMAAAISYMNENGTYYYKPQADDYTESAADALVTIELFDSTYGSNHSIQKERSIGTILNRQLSNGAFLRTGRLLDGYSIWYTDNIGKSIAHWLYLTTT
jgi:hypothetical protein